MKLNKQKIEEIKNKLTNIKEKIKSDEKTQVPRKYYALLILMLLLGTITLSNNIKEYNKSNTEDYVKYTLEESSQTNEDGVEVVDYKIDQSSISTDEPNMQKEVIETISENKEVANEEYIMPVIGEVIKEFAVDKLVYSNTLGMWKTHPGIDIKVELGTNVKSASSGTVQEVKQDSFYGYTIKIVDEKGYTFVYGNLDSDTNLKNGDKVEQGDIIGNVGVSATGELADETHLHFEVLKEETQINPQELIANE